MKILALFILVPVMLGAAEWQDSGQTKYYYERFRLAPERVECWIFVFESALPNTETRAHRNFPGLLDRPTLAEYGIYEVIEYDLNSDGTRAGVSRKSRSIFKPYAETHKGRRDVNQHSFELMSEECPDTGSDGCDSYLTAPVFSAAESVAALVWADATKMAEFERMKTEHLAELTRLRTQAESHQRLPSR